MESIFEMKIEFLAKAKESVQSQSQNQIHDCFENYEQNFHQKQIWIKRIARHLKWYFELKHFYHFETSIQKPNQNNNPIHALTFRLL